MEWGAWDTAWSLDWDPRGSRDQSKKVHPELEGAGAGAPVLVTEKPSITHCQGLPGDFCLY